ncbi:MAG: hypothetical protein KIT80_11710 [Chitinophagaceae bacterium]|nr:hypothetical protein [Chitinophagaceae bacterium]MCW5927568.1 hypothetical protein [Chitinophagaceae bacterium]
MKHIHTIGKLLKLLTLMPFILLSSEALFAQDSTAVETPEVTEEEAVEENTAPARKYVKNTFESIWLIDNQTVMVPIKGTFEMDILHRFGTVDNGYKDFYGLFASSNIRLGFNYSLTGRLMTGVAITKSNMTWEGYVKYAILTQTRGNEYPVSLTWYSNMAVETRLKENYIHASDRFSYFHQLLIARKINDRISVQVAPSLTHMNFVYGQFVDSFIEKSGKIRERKHDHLAVSVAGRFRIKEGMYILANYDQPLTRHKTGNPHPNLSLGLEVTTSSHAFQIFMGNYYFMTPQRNNYYNQNNYRDQQFLIGFNITRLWNF